jgi:hypothetical protein
MDASPRHQSDDRLGPVERFWRNRLFARIRNRLTGLRRTSPAVTRAHAALIRLSSGRIRRSFNAGFDEYRNLTERQIPVVLLEPT